MAAREAARASWLSAGVLLGGLRVGHARQLLLDRADAREGRLAIVALLAKLAGELAQLALELLAARVGVLDVLLADLVGLLLDALGDALGSLARGAALVEQVVLRIRPGDEQQGHGEARADDDERPSGKLRPERASHVDLVQSGSERRPAAVPRAASRAS